MKHIFYLSGANTDLAAAEVLKLFDVDDFELNGRVLLTNKKINETKLHRLAYTKKAYKYLFECSYANLFSKLEKYNWNKIYSGSFAIRFENKKRSTGYTQKDIAPFIWNSIKRPKVNLTKPKTPIELIFSDDKIYCGLLKHDNHEKFTLRRAPLRPGFHPSSLDPKLARACVNLLGNTKEIIDPFCGSGGFLIEAGLMGLKITGYDIDVNMLNKCEKNLLHYKLKNFKLKKQNALELTRNLGSVVTDLPYGKNTKGGSRIKEQHKEFIKNIKKRLKRNAVIIFPHFVNHRKILKDNKLKIDKEFKIRVNKSLTRNVVLIKK